MEKRLSDHQNSSKSENQTTTSIDQETKITIRAENDQNSARAEDGDEKSTGLLIKDKGIDEEDKYSFRIDLKSGGCFEERVCRICHLSQLEEKGKKEMVDLLIELGCGCKGELGFAHTVCAEAWFKLRGNRSCEICGLPANNITGVSDNRFMEVWNENRLVNGTNANVSETRRCWQGQPLCNFLMGCLVIAFVLPWFFRVNMF